MSSEPPVVVRCLGRFSIALHGHRLDLDRLRPQSRQVLQMLAVHGEAPVHREVLADALWPEADPRRSFARLHTAVYDLPQHPAAALRADLPAAAAARLAQRHRRLRPRLERRPPRAGRRPRRGGRRCAAHRLGRLRRRAAAGGGPGRVAAGVARDAAPARALGRADAGAAGRAALTPGQEADSEAERKPEASAEPPLAGSDPPVGAAGPVETSIDTVLSGATVPPAAGA
jgi:hypothetical protein